MNMNSLIPFSFEGQSFRVFSQNGEPQFVLPDVCKVLDIRNSRDAASRLDDDEKGVVIADTLGGPQEMTVITESGLWSLVLTSRKPEAKRFKKWITSEVIPAIRKTGGYMVAAQDETPEQLALRAMQVLQATVERQKAQLSIVQPKADALDRIAGVDGSMCVTDAAKALQMRPKELSIWLQSHGWAYRRAGNMPLLGYQAKVQSGYLTHKVTAYIKADGTEGVNEQMRITAKGLAKLAEVFPPPAQAA